MKFKIFPRNTVPISTKLGIKHPWMKEIHVCSSKGTRLLQETLPIIRKLGTKHPWDKEIQIWSSKGPSNS